MIKLSFTFLVLLTLAILSLEAQKRQEKQKKGWQIIPQHDQPNGQQNSNKDGNKKLDNANKILRKERTNFIHLIPGLGSVSGRTITSEWSGKTIIQFFDVPYAKTTSGSSRFKAPIPVASWKNVLNAERPRHGCPSLQDLVSYEMLKSKNIDVEDCLRLTINTKSVTGNAPVMVYIHGDFLHDGSNLEAAPGYLLEENVVLVAIRYRLGPYGFLSTLTDEIPGNVGLMDVVLALQWVKDHISAFGGDPSRVTLFGQVGGAAIIHVLTMSPIVPEGLFHRVIYHSGSALSPAFVTDNPLQSAKEIGRMAGCKNINKIDFLNKCLRKLNATELLEAFSLHISSKSSVGVGLYGAVQFVVGGPSGVLPQFPSQILTSGNFKAYPTLGGSVSNGGTFLLRDIYIDNLSETISDDTITGAAFIRYVISQTSGADPNDAWKQFAEKQVFSPEIMKNGSFYAMIPGLIDLCSTISFKNPVLLAMQGNAQKLPNSTFLYSFDYEGEFNRYAVTGVTDIDTNDMPFDLGVSLTDENLFLFPWPRYSLLNSNRDIKIAKRMVSYWTSFAANGKPSAPHVPEWPSMADETGPYLKIGKTVSVKENYLEEFIAAVRETDNGFNLVNEEFFEIQLDTEDEEPEAERVVEILY